MTDRSELLAASDATIEDAMQYASPMVLRGLLYQLTGDESVIDMKPGAAAKFVVGSELADPEDEKLIRKKAADFLKAYRDSGAGDIDIGPVERLRTSLSLTAGQPIPEKDFDIWQEETALDRWARGVKWSGGKTPDAAKNFRVAVIGTGISGLNTAVQLKRAGIPFTVFEKNPEVGGSWYENRYPGARVDTPSRGYTHLFAYDYPFNWGYSPRDVNLKYFKWVADNFEIRDNIEFNTEVLKMTWDDEAKVWKLGIQGPSGATEQQFNAVISCVGFLSRPQMPDIEGMDSFSGTLCHSAAWPDDLDITGKRVAIVGSGASGYQTAPVIGSMASETFLFQRQANWLYEDLSYLKKLPEQTLWLDRNFPFHANFVRFRVTSLVAPSDDGGALKVDPNFKDPYAVSPVNKALRDACVAFVSRKLESRPDLIPRMIPNFPPMASRPIRVDTHESVLDALARGDVELVSDSIDRITPSGIEAGGKSYDLDVIVFATGFRANEYLWPMEVRGKSGERIEKIWEKDGPRAYLGVMVPDFPNLFMIYGPNSNNFGGFSVVNLLEVTAQFSLRAIAGLIENGQASVDVTHDAYWRFADILDKSEEGMVYLDPRANSYYQNGGRSSVNGPVDYRRMWRWLNDPAGDAPAETDDGMRPYFEEDLVVT
ncbi:MAG: NAD(P)-binding protein [Novosphingobium sp.]|nr:NAD(P)-binding protein [Novosphingobium sp.]